MDYATIAFGVLGLINAWVLVGIRSNQRTIEGLKTADAEMSKAISGIQLLIAGQYLTRNEFQAAMQQQTQSIVAAIDRIDAKVEKKADK